MLILLTGAELRDNQLIVSNLAYNLSKNLFLMVLYVQPGTSTENKENVLREWYRRHLKKIIPPLIPKWKPIVGLDLAHWGVKKMKTKWGACNIKDQGIWLNLELAKKPPKCLEYIIVHEMVHLLERLHNDNFRLLMDKFLPQWRLNREELNRSSLGHEDWSN